MSACNTERGSAGRLPVTLRPAEARSGQKLECIVGSAGMDLATVDLAQAMGVCPKLVRHVVVLHALMSQEDRGHSLIVAEGLAADIDRVQSYARERVSLYCHGGNLLMAMVAAGCNRFVTWICGIARGAAGSPFGRLIRTQPSDTQLPVSQKDTQGEQSVYRGLTHPYPQAVGGFPHLTTFVRAQ